MIGMTRTCIIDLRARVNVISIFRAFHESRGYRVPLGRVEWQKGKSELLKGLK